jgi:hypothetical protein
MVIVGSAHWTAAPQNQQLCDPFCTGDEHFEQRMVLKTSPQNQHVAASGRIGLPQDEHGIGFGGRGTKGTPADAAGRRSIPARQANISAFCGHHQAMKKPQVYRPWTQVVVQRY